MDVDAENVRVTRSMSRARARAIAIAGGIGNTQENAADGSVRSPDRPRSVTNTRISHSNPIAHYSSSGPNARRSAFRSFAHVSRASDIRTHHSASRPDSITRGSSSNSIVPHSGSGAPARESGATLEASRRTSGPRRYSTMSREHLIRRVPGVPTFTANRMTAPSPGHYERRRRDRSRPRRRNRRASTTHREIEYINEVSEPPTGEFDLMEAYGFVPVLAIPAQMGPAIEPPPLFGEEEIEFLLTKIAVIDEGEVCCVCRDGLNAEDDSRMIGCGHTFHFKCIETWIQKKATCPLCRHDIRKRFIRKRKLNLNRLPYDDDEY